MATAVKSTTSLIGSHTNVQVAKRGVANGVGDLSIPLRRQKVDPLRALEPARKKLTSIESQRIMAVLVDTIRKIEMTGLFPSIIEQLSRFSVMLGPQLVSMFEEHNILMNSFKELKTEAEKLIISESKRQQEIRKHTDFNGEMVFEDCARENKEIASEIGFNTRATNSIVSTRSMSRSHSRSRATSRNKSLTKTDVAPKVPVVPNGMTYIGAIPMPIDIEDLDQENDADNNAHIRANEEKLREVINMTDNGDRCETAIKQMMLVAKEMQNSCRSILRALCANPSAVNSLIKENPNQRVAINDILHEMNELRMILNHKLLTTPIEEVERNDYLQVIMKRDKNNTANIKKLSKELDVAVEDKNMEIRKKNDIIRKLQSELYLLEKYSDENIRRTRNDADKQEAADSKNSDGKKQKLTTEVNTLKTSHQTLIDEHRISESNLRKKKFKVETECENWIQKYDADMTERQDEFEMIDEVYSEEKKQLCELEERFKTLETEYVAIQEERTIERNKRELEDQKLRTKKKAVTTIQAFWRSFKVRKALKSKKKPGKGKKGKK